MPRHLHRSKLNTLIVRLKLKLTFPSIQNIVGTAFLGHAVDMDKTFEWLKSQVVFKNSVFCLSNQLTFSRLAGVCHCNGKAKKMLKRV